MKRLVYMLVLLLAFGGGRVMGQGGLHIERPVWDFGTAAEDGGPIGHTFTVENRGKHPVVILDIATSCGCTKPRFTRRPLLPGGSDKIEVSFNPAGMSGMVERTLTLYGERQQVIGRLVVRGKITPRKRTVEERYLIDLGQGLRLADNFLTLGELRHNELREIRIGVVNTASEERRLAFVPQGENPYCHIEAPEWLAAGEEGELIVQVEVPASSHLYGTWQMGYRILIDGEPIRIPLTLNALLVDASPRGGGCARIEEMNIHVGDVQRDKGPHCGELVIHNDGRTPLTVRTILLEDGMSSSLRGGEVIPAGGVLRAEVWIDTSEMDFGGFSKRFQLVVSGQEPLRRLRLSGVVIE